jgi:(1->4)-alpha-D-glucan 1-alpha-D-glucosylmutase
MRRPRATYRIQARGTVRFHDIRKLIPYLEGLGVSHVYLSPILHARRGSPHGYDVVDPTRVDPALGGEAELGRLVHALHRRGLGLVLDFVPNHLAADPENPFFEDVLAHGPASRFACWFDIDWGKPRKDRHEPLVVPLLGSPLRRALARGELALVRTRGRIRLRCADRSFPLDPSTLAPVLRTVILELRNDARASADIGKVQQISRQLRGIPPRTATDPRTVDTRARMATAAEDGLASLLRLSARVRAALDRALARFNEPQGRSRLQRLLDRQAYRVGYWRNARHRLNYRRFFDVNDLVGIRPEDPAVFAATHAKALEWVEAGWLDGLRIDHIDGLLDPLGYLHQLREATDRRPSKDHRNRFLLFVEKILAHGERLPASWPVDGTTGYDFLNQVEASLLDPRGAADVEAAWLKQHRFTRPFEQTSHACKRLALESLLTADVRRLTRSFFELLAPHRGQGRPAGRDLRAAIVEVIAHLAVYRTYIDGCGTVSEADQNVLETALEGARRGGRAERSVLDQLGKLLLLDDVPGGTSPDDRDRLAFVQRFQQLSGPAAAKGVEDTALYVHTPLLARNEVGSDPDSPLTHAVEEYHLESADRAARGSQTLLSVTTHDTKRSADVRARLDVLSEIPAEWEAAVKRWRRWNQKHRQRAGRRIVPDATTERFLYQTLVGVWPLPPPTHPARTLSSRSALRELRERIESYMQKASREANMQTSWLDPDPVYEDALRTFVRSTFEPATRKDGPDFVEDVNRFVSHIARPGLWNALSRTIIQLTSPGVPDLYQGDELWNFVLVDPDNRRPVDFRLRERLLGRVQAGFEAGAAARRTFLRELVARAEDGRIKLHLIRTALRARLREENLFLSPHYAPLETRGPKADHLVTFIRRLGRRVAVVAAPRLPLQLVGDSTRAPLGRSVWAETRLALPRDLIGRNLESVLI